MKKEMLIGSVIFFVLLQVALMFLLLNFGMLIGKL